MVFRVSRSLDCVHFSELLGELEKFVGKDGLKIGVDNFGLSAPGTDVAQHFNFTKENIKNKIEEYLSE